MKLIALLRAINVGGHVVKMDQLRAILEAEGLSGVETFIASGNVIFEGRPNQATKVEATIERALCRELGYEVATFVRTAAELAAVAAHAPFTPAAVAAANTSCIGFLKAPLDRNAERRLMALGTEADTFHVYAREVYWLSTVKQNESKFSNAMFERAVRESITFRGVKTVRKMAAKYSGFKGSA